MKISTINFFLVISVINGVANADSLFGLNELATIYATVNCLNCLTAPEELITFYNYKPGSTVYNQVFINDTDVENKIDLSKPVCFIIHGWTDSFSGGLLYPNKLWMQEMAKEITRNQNINAIAVDWKYLALCEYVWTSQENVPCVGNYLAKFIEYLVPFGLKVEETIIVGHSFGAQMAGLTGAKLFGKLGTIFGLDPAGFLYSHPVIVSTDKRLDMSDAHFVQILHTASGTFGQEINSGHADFHPNLGILQPGCLLSYLTPYVCSHIKSIDYFISSITNPLKGYDLRTGSCQLMQIFIMKFYRLFNLSSPSLLCEYRISDFIGFQTGRIHGIFYLRTSANPPYYVD